MDIATSLAQKHEAGFVEMTDELIERGGRAVGSIAPVNRTGTVNRARTSFFTTKIE
ncbi:MAG: hypothetical protein R2867_27425 [Caldilineaceae bacterium]